MLSFPPSPQVRVFVAREPIDLRKGFDGLSSEVIEVIDEDPQSGHLFLFFNRRRNMMKALIWEASGYWLIYKRLEHGRFQIFDKVGSKASHYEMMTIDLALLLDGIDLRGARRRLSHDDLFAKT